jgi:ribosomal protein S27AE
LADAAAAHWSRSGSTRGPVVFAHMKTPTTRQELLRARRSLVSLGLAGALGLGAFGYVDLHHHTPLEMPVFCVIFGIFIAFGALISNALRCPKCGLHQFYNDGVGRDFRFCPKCGADFSAPMPPRLRVDSPAGR